jgi:hypothetical protein
MNAAAITNNGSAIKVGELTRKSHTIFARPSMLRDDLIGFPQPYQFRGVG